MFLALAHTKTAEPLNIFWRIVAVPARSTPGKRQRAEALANSQPSYADAEGVSTFGD